MMPEVYQRFEAFAIPIPVTPDMITLSHRPFFPLSYPLADPALKRKSFIPCQNREGKNACAQ